MSVKIAVIQVLVSIIAGICYAGYVILYGIELSAKKTIDLIWTLGGENQK